MSAGNFDFRTKDPFWVVKNLGLLQRQAGVDPELGDLVCAYGRILTDLGLPLNFYQKIKSPALSFKQKSNRIKEQNPNLEPRVLNFLENYAAYFEVRQLPVVCV